MSVLDNVALGAYLRGRAGVVRAALRLDRAEEARTRAEAARALARTGLAAHMHDAAGSLSLGKQRIVEIARALAADPVLLLLDEPARRAALGEKQELAALLRQLRGEGMTLLLVEHDMDFVMGLTDRAGGDGLRREAGRRRARSDPARSACARSLPGRRVISAGSDGRPSRSARPARRLRQGRGGPRRLPARPGRPDRHGDRSQRCRQVDAARGADGPAPARGDVLCDGEVDHGNDGRAAGGTRSHPGAGSGGSCSRR